MESILRLEHYIYGPHTNSRLFIRIVLVLKQSYSFVLLTYVCIYNYLDRHSRSKVYRIDLGSFSSAKVRPRVYLGMLMIWLGLLAVNPSVGTA